MMKRTPLGLLGLYQPSWKQKKHIAETMRSPKKLTYIIAKRRQKMNDIAELIEVKIDAVVTSVLANKLDFLDKDNQFSPLMTQSEARKWLGVGDDTLKYYILKGMPVIKKGDKIYRIPRDAVKEWIKNEWRNI